MCEGVCMYSTTPKSQVKTQNAIMKGHVKAVYMESKTRKQWGPAKFENDFPKKNCSRNKVAALYPYIRDVFFKTGHKPYKKYK